VRQSLPGTTIELVEISTRRQLIEQQTETLIESTSRAEHAETSRDELSDAVKDENSNNSKLGVATTNTVNMGVYQVTVTASFGIESTRKAAREQTHRTTHEQSEKLATEIRKSTRSLFRTVTETNDTRSRRYLLQNTTDRLINYELRRKMRRVGVQLQDLGTRLCWQVFVDDPGGPLGLSELVHFAPSPDLSSLKLPDLPPRPAPITKRVIAPLPFKPILSYTNSTHRYEFQGLDPNGRGFLGLVADDRPCSTRPTRSTPMRRPHTTPSASRSCARRTWTRCASALRPPPQSIVAPGGTCERSTGPNSRGQARRCGVAEQSVWCCVGSWYICGSALAQLEVQRGGAEQRDRCDEGCDDQLDGHAETCVTRKPESASTDACGEAEQHSENQHLPAVAAYEMAAVGSSARAWPA
jgi:hypothetical protein